MDGFNTDDAVKLAYIEQRQGNAREARALLLETLAVIRELPRLGTFGYGIRDEPRFVAILGELDGYLAAMYDRFIEARAANELDDLRAMAETI